MKIKNKHLGTIGFGDVCVLPDEIKELPKAYAKDHPIVTFYVQKGWIEIVEFEAIPTKSLDRMTKEELQARAAELCIDFAETDVRQTLIDKIKAEKKSEAKSDDKSEAKSDGAV